MWILQSKSFSLNEQNSFLSFIFTLAPSLAGTCPLAPYILVYMKSVKGSICKPTSLQSFRFKIQETISFWTQFCLLLPDGCLAFLSGVMLCLPHSWKDFSHFTYFLIFHLNHPECMSRIPDEDGKDEKAFKMSLRCTGKMDRVTEREVAPW